MGSKLPNLDELIEAVKGTKIVVRKESYVSSNGKLIAFSADTRIDGGFDLLDCFKVSKMIEDLFGLYASSLYVKDVNFSVGVATIKMVFRVK